jgi:undecaprenyldiphospho-muramoylpentapeptide beta-N-acetylglucosaminyltransferase
MTFAVVTGGGTSGHVLPALAIAEALVGRGHDRDDIHYVGTSRGVEVRLLPPTGFPHTFLDVVGLQRRVTLANLWVVPKLLRSTWRAVRLLKSLRPKVVVNVGGYASFPATFAARLRRVPVVVVSYDRRPGLVSKLMARGAAACAVAFPDSVLPHAVHTGAPVRREIVEVDRVAGRDAARAALGLPADRFVLAVCCGSLGAQAVNEVVAQAVQRWYDRRDLAVHHVVGERYVASAAADRDGHDGILYHVIGYEERMADVYAAADLLVTRAGAGTIAELATTGAPAIVVPWPGAAENHQVDNARVLSEVGAALLVEQHDLTADRLIDEVERLRTHPVELAALAERARAAGTVHRSGALVDLVEAVAAR